MPMFGGGNENKTIQIKKWRKAMNRHITEKEIQMANKHIEGCSALEPQ